MATFFNKASTWTKAMRLRTLPLALSSSVLGSFIAFSQGNFNLMVFVFSSITITFLQVLSNFANDLGDSESGVDNKHRAGPLRSVQSGRISKVEMKKAIKLMVLLSFISGITLIYFGLNGLDLKRASIFIILGATAIFAAIKYTIGKNPYGYLGLGDLFVFLYFGIVGVVGTYYLHTHVFDPWILLPASAIGLLSSGVLNLNNMRDIENDSKSGKKTLVVRIGSKAAKLYHTFLISLSIVLGTIYNVKHFNSFYQLLFLITIPFFVFNIKAVIQNNEPLELNNELRKLALSTFAFSLTFGLGLVTHT